MKHLSGYDNVLETEAWCFWGNMKVLLGHLDRARDTESPRSDPADKIFWVSVLSAMFLSGQKFC